MRWLERDSAGACDAALGGGVLIPEAPCTVACLYIPDFLVALARREHPELKGRPVVIGGSPEEHAEVRACSPEATKTGIVVGTTLRRALALCRDAVFLPHRAAEAAAEAARVVAFLQGQSPVVEKIEQGHVHFDVRGLPYLAGMSEDLYFRDLAEGVGASTGLPLSVGAADTVFTAHAAAVAQVLETDLNSAWISHVVVRSPRRYVAMLPVETLPVAPAVHQRLRLFGLESLGQVAELSLSALQAQFGPDGARIWKLSKGEDDSVLSLQLEDLKVAEEMDLPAPAVTVGPLLAATRALLQRAFVREDVRDRSVRQLDWHLGIESGETLTRRVVFREPTRDVSRIMFAFQGRLEHLQLPAVGISIALTLSGFCSEYAQQGNLWATGPKLRRELLDSIEQLNVRAGGPQVFRIVEVQPWSRIPERQLALAPYGP